VGATIPTIDEVRAAVHEEVDALRRELLAALHATTGEQLLSVAEAARIASASPRTVQRWLREGLRSVGAGRVRRVRRADLDAWLTRG
jgi:excisionase family DNA binding protein